MTRYYKFILIGRTCCIAAALLCLLGGALFPPLHMLGILPVLGTLILLVPWDQLVERWGERRKKRRDVTRG